MYLENIALELIAPDKTKEILADYYLACLSRELSLLGRKEVHNGKAHFGIFGDGKEIVQLAMAKSFQKGDWRSGYYRDQTLMLALGLMKPEEFFAMIYGDTSGVRNPSTGGRNFNNHFSTPNIDEKGEIKGLSYKYNSAADLSPTAGQMPRLLGLAQASKLVRNNMNFKRELSGNITGNEVSFGTIGDASTSEGMFFETINAACVMQVPMAVTIYDDGYGISVPVELQTAKGSISEALRGFAQDEKGKGCKIYHCHGWDYPSLVKMFSEGVAYCREYQIPVIFHVDELTQPTGHSTSGSHERYKSNDRLEWELKNDALKKFREFILATGETGHDTLLNIEAEAMQRAKKARDDAWNSFTGSFSQEKKTLLEILSSLPDGELRKRKMEEWKLIEDKLFPLRRSLLVLAKRTLYELKGDNRSTALTERLQEWINHFSEVGHEFYSRYLYNENRSEGIDFVEPRYGADPQWVNGSDILNINFDALFERHPTLLTFGEDTGKLGDVNQGMKGMQEKYGDHRVFDTGIREATIIGQGIGLALRGLRPIAEIQYLDYLLYALTPNPLKGKPHQPPLRGGYYLGTTN
jgi:TPP-dependent pyruvate/acetoin dehydrogenase alpha subunit